MKTQGHIYLHAIDKHERDIYTYILYENIQRKGSNGYSWALSYKWVNSWYGVPTMNAFIGLLH
jgi:hypothetical protein